MDSITNKKTLSQILLIIKHDFANNKKSILLTLAVIYGFCIVIGGFIGSEYRGGGSNQALALMFVLSVMGWCISSFAFSDMKTKEGRIAALMLPAEIWQKFFVRWFAMVVGLFFLLVIGFYLLEFSRVLMNIAVYGYSGSGNPYYHIINPFEVIFSFRHGSQSQMNLTLFSGYFLNQALFFWGAILWPKHSFIKTLATLWGIEAILVIVLLLHKIFYGNFISLEITIDHFPVWIIIIQVILIITIYTLSYIRFKRSQVVYRLF